MHDINLLKPDLIAMYGPRPPTKGNTNMIGGTDYPVPIRGPQPPTTTMEPSMRGAKRMPITFSTNTKGGIDALALACDGMKNANDKIMLESQLRAAEVALANIRENFDKCKINDKG